MSTRSLLRTVSIFTWSNLFGKCCAKANVLKMLSTKTIDFMIIFHRTILFQLFSFRRFVDCVCYFDRFFFFYKIEIKFLWLANKLYAENFTGLKSLLFPVDFSKIHWRFFGIRSSWFCTHLDDRLQFTNCQIIAKSISIYLHTPKNELCTHFSFDWRSEMVGEKRRHMSKYAIER